MNEQYTSVYFLPENLYASGAPVIVSAGALLKDNQTGHVLAQLKLTNIQYKTIKAVKVRLFPRDVMGQPVGCPLDCQYLDLQIPRDGEFGMNAPILLPDATTRAFAAEVIAVVFSDSTAWTSDGAQWEPIPTRVALHSQYDQHVIEQLRLERGGVWQFAFQKHKDLWLCTCGAVNHEGETRCHGCGIQESLIHSLDIQGLAERAYMRMKMEAQQASVEKTAAEAQKRTRAKLLKIVIPLVCAVAVFVILLNSWIIPNGKYKAAVALMNAGQYEEAIEAFEAMDGYKDSDQKIEECETAILDSKYENAVALMAAGKYDEAIAAFSEIQGYRDADELSIECSEAKLFESARSNFEGKWIWIKPENINPYDQYYKIDFNTMTIVFYFKSYTTEFTRTFEFVIESDEVLRATGFRDPGMVQILYKGDEIFLKYPFGSDKPSSKDANLYLRRK